MKVIFVAEIELDEDDLAVADNNLRQAIQDRIGFTGTVVRAVDPVAKHARRCVLAAREQNGR